MVSVSFDIWFSGPSAIERYTRVDEAGDSRGCVSRAQLRVRRLEHEHIACSDLVAGASGRASLEALIRGYFAQGGMQVHVKVLDPDILEAAMRDPDNYRNLLVRVSGYCAYFVDLTPEMQQELIDRTRQRA